MIRMNQAGRLVVRKATLRITICLFCLAAAGAADKRQSAGEPDMRRSETTLILKSPLALCYSCIYTLVHPPLMNQALGEHVVYSAQLVRKRRSGGTRYKVKKLLSEVPPHVVLNVESERMCPSI